MLVVIELVGTIFIFNYRHMKKLVAVIFIIFFISNLSSCSSMTAGQQKMNKYNMMMNDHPHRDYVQAKRMKRGR